MIYTIKKDSNNDTRFRIPDIFTGKFKKTWTVSLAPSCWYPKELGYNQINKLVGVTEFWSANNKNSVMVGWDPCYLPEEEILEKYPHCKNLGAPLTDVKYFNIYSYINDKDGGHVARFWTIIADWRINDLVVTMQNIKGNEYAPDMLESAIKVLQFSGNETTPSFEFSNPVREVISGSDLGTPAYRVKALKGWLREIFLWFGGTRKAPQDMQFKVN